MGEIAIQAQHLAKRYAIGAGEQHNTLRDRLGSWMASLVSPRSTPERAPHSFWALTDVSFEVKRGEVFGIIGHNGAGKSTLLKILSRITAPTSGSVDLYGRVSSLLEVGTGFHPELTGRENIRLNAAILGMRGLDISRRLDQIIDFSGVEKFIDTPVKRYSSGMYVRLAFSVAAHLEPDILIVDEVLAVGDASFQEKCLGKMRQARQGGRTVLIVSHNLPIIENLCERALLLANGRIATVGDAKTVVEAYAGMSTALAKSTLSERTDRQGIGRVRATAIEVLDGNGKACPSTVCGRDTILRWHYRCAPQTEVRNCRVELSLHAKYGDHFDTAYFVMSTDLVDPSPLDLSGEGCIEFRLAELPLSEGNYHVMSYVEGNKEVQDWVYHAALVTVLDGDFYGTGKSYPPGWKGKCVLVKYSWQRRPNTPPLDISASSQP